MDDDEALECLRRKMITGRHGPNDKLEHNSQGTIFNLCRHALGRLKRSATLNISTRSKNSSAAQDALSFQTHNEHQHKGCHGAEEENRPHG